MKIRVPASIANIGPGFDVLAMAVDLWLEVEAEPSDQPHWRFQGEGAEYLGATPNPLSALSWRGEVRCDIPMGVGLGSSAAARLAAAVLRGELDPLGSASAEEGHPDNAAAAWSGGVVMVIEGQVHRLPAAELELALLVATLPLPTEQARAALPATVPHPDAVFNAARLGLLIHALDGRHYELLDAATQDRLHQPYREHLYPFTAAAMAAARAAGALGSAVCGAGPSVFAFCRPGEGERIAQAMADAAPGRGRPLATQISPQGLQVWP
ncbi:MAG TPA: homoserine kinase [Candidatus Nitrosotalea sp.]|nr:homoserine kinase [Candidatus Nitrosotalea sp.]